MRPEYCTQFSSSRVLCSVLGPSVQEGHQGPGIFPEKGYEAGEEPGTQVLSGVAEGSSVVESVEEEIPGETFLLSTTT